MSTAGRTVQVRTVGQRLLIRTRRSASAIAKEIKAAPGTVARWRDGIVSPHEKHRRTLLHSFGIPMNTWEESLPDGTRMRLPKIKRGPKTKKEQERIDAAIALAQESDDDENDGELSAPAVAEAPTHVDVTQPEKRRVKPKKNLPPAPPPEGAPILTHLRYSLACIRHDLRFGENTSATKSKLRADESRTLALLAKLQREEELREDKYVKNHPAFLAHCQLILRSLRPFPAASKAVVAALRNSEPEK